MEPSNLRAVFLSGPTIYLRAVVDRDKEDATAWLGETFPMNSPGAESVLKEDLRRPWWERSGVRLVIVRREGDVVVGGVTISWGSEVRRCRVEFSMAPCERDADALRAAALQVLVRWLRDGMEAMVVSLMVPADQVQTVDAAEAVGMQCQGTLREWFARPGGRTDALVYEALNPRWVVPDA